MMSAYHYEIEIQNKYLKQPTIEQILDFINELGVTCYQFERFYSIPQGVLKQVKGGHRPLPVRYWPLFYERIVPKYGTSFNEINAILFNKKQVTSQVTRITHKSSDSHNRVTTLK